ncbi:MAG: polymer-forming cytoskeletal protein [bacterium]|nr:polymer-forming cytoskeletal protein [bacterium]
MLPAKLSAVRIAASSTTRLGAALLLALIAWTSFAQPSGDESAPAYHLQSGSIARNRIVALGQDMLIDGEALSDAVALSGTARVSGTVIGDLIVLDGDAFLASTAKVGGDVYVLSGRIDAAPGCTIDGRSVAYPDASALWVALIQGPAMGMPATSPLVLGAKLALLAFWSFVILLLFAIGRREVLSTSDSVRVEPFRNFFVGLTGVAAMVLTALFFSAFAGALIGVPLLVLVVVAALVLRFWGMVAVFHALGDWISRRLGVRPPPPLTAAAYGLLALGLLKFLPFIGVWTWSVATFIGVGAALSTKLGRREPWLEPA